VCGAGGGDCEGNGDFVGDDCVDDSIEMRANASRRHHSTKHEADTLSAKEREAAE
jgi:hypothetical protein